MSEIENWFTKIREFSNLRISRIPLRDSKEWSLQNGFIVHQTGRFFQVAGLQYQWHGRDILQPIFVQQEVGILGFILCNHKLLAYAKVEPGNVNSVQLAPTCQATASNLDRVHRGHLPLFGEWFVNNSTGFLYDSLQSEQGTRFFNKQNRNILLASPSQFDHNEMHAWLHVDLVLELLRYDFLVNTDARSSLVCSPWNQLVDREPFTRYADDFSLELYASFKALIPNENSLLDRDLKSLRSLFSIPSLVPINKITDWILTENGLESVDRKFFDIFLIQVQVDGRELPSWDQPIISSNGEGYVELVCGRINGILHFLFILKAEPGLYNMVELAPSLTVSPGSTQPDQTYASMPGTKVLLECLHSEEGGRFYQDVSTYRLIDTGEAFSPPQHGYWLTLSKIRVLLNKSGWFTNEARSAISLLLTWL